MTDTQRERRRALAARLRRLANRLDTPQVAVIALGEPAMMLTAYGQELLVPRSHPYAQYTLRMALQAARN